MTEHTIGPEREYRRLTDFIKANKLRDGDRVLLEPSGDYIDDVPEPIVPHHVQIIGLGGLAEPCKFWMKRRPRFSHATQKAIAVFFGLADAATPWSPAMSALIAPHTAEATAALVAQQPTPFDIGPRSYTFTRADGATLVANAGWYSKVNKGIITSKVGQVGLSVEGIEFRNALDGSSANAAGVRHQQGGGFTVKFCRFINCQNGILSGNQHVANPNAPWITLSGSLAGQHYALSGYAVITDSDFFDCGHGGLAHGIYVGKCAEVLVLRNKFRDQHGGHAIKVDLGGGGVAMIGKNRVLDNDLVDLSKPSTNYAIDVESGHVIAWDNDPLIKVRSLDATTQSRMFLMGNRRNWSPTGNTVILVGSRFENRMTKSGAIVTVHDYNGQKDHESANLSIPAVAEYVSRDLGPIHGYIGENVLLGGTNVKPIVTDTDTTQPADVVIGPNQLGLPGDPLQSTPIGFDGPRDQDDFLPALHRIKDRLNPLAHPAVDLIIAAMRHNDQFDGNVIVDAEEEVEDPMRIRELEEQVAALTAERDSLSQALGVANTEIAEKASALSTATAALDAERAKIANFNTALTALAG